MGNKAKGRPIWTSLALLTISFTLSGCLSLGKKTSAGPDETKSSPSKIGLDIRAKKFTLSNGLRLIVLENHKLPLASMYTFFEVGGRHELKGFTGSSHFLEHLMFKGSSNFPPGSFEKNIEGTGGNTNAYTTFDNTVYQQSFPVSALSTVMAMEADRMQRLSLRPNDFEKERLVVLEERKLRYENSPKGKIYLKMMQSIFNKTPYGGSVIGSQRDLKAIKLEEVKKYYGQFYVPNNAIVVVAGDVRANEVHKMAKKLYGDFPKGQEFEKVKAQRDNPKFYKFKKYPPRTIRLKGNAPNPIFILAYRGLPLDQREAQVLDILSSILGDGDSSYFGQLYVKGGRPLLSSIGVSNYTLRYNGVFFIMGELLKGTSLNKFRKRLLKQTLKVCDKAIDERSLQKTKNQYLISYLRNVETNDGVAHFIGNREHFFGDYKFYKKELAIYNSITVNEVKSSCKKFLANGRGTFLSIWNKHR